jgi:hypothetical protein
MSENAQLPLDDDGKPTIWLSFCPDLGLYHLHREVDGEDPSDSKFTRAELVDMVEGLMRATQIEQATQLATFCAWARLFAHKVVMFTTTGTFRVYNPTPQDESEHEESEDMKKFFAEWRESHPNDADLPTVPERT